MAVAADSMLGMTMRFSVSIDGVNLADWSKASGLEVSWDVVEFRSGDNSNERWIAPGIAKYPTVKLERAANKDASQKVREWLNKTSFTHTPKSGKIELQDAGKTVVATWELANVMPVKWSIVAFDANGNKVALETLELAHTGFLVEA